MTGVRQPMNVADRGVQRQTLTRNTLSGIEIASQSRIPGSPQREPETDAADEEERPAIREEWQGNTGNRHQVDRHPDVLEDMGEPESEDAEHDKTAEGISSASRDPDERGEEQDEKSQGHEHANEAQLLSHHRKDEVGMLLGKERESFLRPLGQARPEPAAGTDRRLGLQ